MKKLHLILALTLCHSFASAQYAEDYEVVLVPHSPAEKDSIAKYYHNLQGRWVSEDDASLYIEVSDSTWTVMRNSQSMCYKASLTNAFIRLFPDDIRSIILLKTENDWPTYEYRFMSDTTMSLTDWLAPPGHSLNYKFMKK